VSKNGAAFAAAGATVTERSSGWYQVALTTGDTDTIGDLVVRCTATACDDAERIVEVTAWDPAQSSQAAVDAALDAASTQLTAVPTTTGSLRQLIQFLAAYFRNRRTVTSSAETLYREDASTSLGSASLSDNGTTYDKGEMN
jgi:hypothetical protein